MNARGIPPTRGRKMLTPPADLPPLLAGPDPPPGRLTDLTPPQSADWPDPSPDLTWPPPCWLDLTPPPHRLDLTPPSPSADWPDPPSPHLTWPPPPPPCGQTNKVKLLPSRRTTYAGGNNITYPIYRSWFSSRQVLFEITLPVGKLIQNKMLQL